MPIIKFFNVIENLPLNHGTGETKAAPGQPGTRSDLLPRKPLSTDRDPQILKRFEKQKIRVPFFCQAGPPEKSDPIQGKMKITNIF
jgi:hypothetical protein